MFSPLQVLSKANRVYPSVADLNLCSLCMMKKVFASFFDFDFGLLKEKCNNSRQAKASTPSNQYIPLQKCCQFDFTSKHNFMENGHIQIDGCFLPKHDSGHYDWLSRFLSKN